MTSTVTIPAGQQRAPLALTGAQPGAAATLEASAPFAVATPQRVQVIVPPSPVLPEGPIALLPRVSEPLVLALDAPAPTAGRTVALDVSNGGALVPASVHLPVGTSNQTFAIEGVTPGDYVLAAVSSDGTTDSAEIQVRQAIATSTPEVIRASSLGNRVRVRVATNGAASLSAVRIEVPAGWSTPDDIRATRGDGTDLSAAVVRGAPGAGPNGGTLVELALPAPIAPADAEPWLEVVFDKMMAFEVFGVSTWPVEVDNGAGYVPMLGDGVHVRVEGTAADGAGLAAITTNPAPLVAGTANASFTLTLDNDVEVVTDPATIFNDWTQHGTDLLWHLFDHAVHGTILRTTENLDPGYFTSDDELSNGTIELDIGALTTDDDDFIGLVFRWVDECNFYLLDWKQADQTFNGVTGKAGLALRRIDDCDHNGDGAPDSLTELWDNEDDAASPRPNVLASELAPANGWVDNTFHALKVVLDGPDIDIYVDGTLRLSVHDPDGFSSGRYGPYAYSQAYTAIRGLKVSRTSTTIATVEAELPPGWPVPAASQITADVDGVDRSAEVIIGGLGPNGGTLLTLLSAGVLPGRRYTLTVSDFTAPPAGDYPVVVRTAGRDGELLDIATPPVIPIE